jgi:hypothetical protein
MPLSVREGWLGGWLFELSRLLWRSQWQHQRLRVQWLRRYAPGHLSQGLELLLELVLASVLGLVLGWLHAGLRQRYPEARFG